jgi:hypothetical protein
VAKCEWIEEIKMQLISLVCAVLGLLAGGISGVYWVRAARVANIEDRPTADMPPLVPSRRPGGPISLGGVGRYIGKSGEFNFKAAAWSIAGVLLTALSTLLNAIAGRH